MAILAHVDTQSATNAIGDLATAEGEEIPLDRGALLIAAAFDHEVDVEHELGVLDSLAQGVARRMPHDLDPLASVNELNDYLFENIGLEGNDTDYYDPKNSLIHEVLRRRLGIPITLSLVYVEVGRRLGVPFQGVGMPGHFLVRHRDERSLYIDPFYKGVLLSEEDCAERLKKISTSVRWDKSFLHPISSRAFLARMLRNLSAIYVSKNEAKQAITALHILVAIQPEEPGHLRDRGLLLHQTGDNGSALSDLESYLNSSFAAPDAWYIQRVVDQIRPPKHS